MAPVMSKPVMLPQSQTQRPDPLRSALRSEGLVWNTPHLISLVQLNRVIKHSDIWHTVLSCLWGINLCLFLWVLMSLLDSPAVSQRANLLLLDRTGAASPSWQRALMKLGSLFFKPHLFLPQIKSRIYTWENNSTTPCFYYQVRVGPIDDDIVHRRWLNRHHNVEPPLWLFTLYRPVKGKAGFNPQERYYYLNKPASHLPWTFLLPTLRHTHTNTCGI